MRTEFAIWCFTGVAATAALALTGQHAREASRERGDALEALQETRRHVETVRTLQAVVPIGQRELPTGPRMATRVTSTLERVGLSAGILANLSPEADTVIRTVGQLQVTRGRATISLAGLSLPQAGRFLDAWRKAEPKWVPTSIDISLANAKPPEVGGDLPLRVVIALESLQVIRNGDGL